VILAKSTKAAGGKKKPLLTERNRIRGLIGASKSRRVVLGDKKPDKFQRTQAFQRGLSAALIQARETIASTQFEEFLSWLQSQTSALLADFKSFKTTSEIAPEVLDAHSLPLNKEILWTITRLMQHTAELCEFQEQSRSLEALIWKHPEWQEVEARLDQIEEEFGKSIWILEARITLAQDFVGLEHQKKIAARERQLKHRGLLTFISHYVSTRSEPSTLANRFIADFETVLNKEASGPLHDFLRYRILGRVERPATGLPNILRVAQGLAEVDLYEALVFVCEQLVSTNCEAIIAEALITGLAKLKDIKDPRISKILLLLGEPQPDRFVHRDLRAADAALVASDYAVTKCALEVLRRDPQEYKAALLAAAHIRGARVREHHAGHRPNWDTVIRQTANVLCYSDTYDSDIDALRKFLNNHSFLPHVRACAHTLLADMQCTAGTEAGMRRIAAVNNPYLDPDELPLVPLSARAEYADELRMAYGDSPSLELQLECLRLQAPESRCRPFSADLIVETVDGLTQTTSAAKKQVLRPERWREVFEGLTNLHAEMYQNDIRAVIRSMADLYLKTRVPLSVIPAVAAVGHLKWKQLKASGADLALPISLHLYWRATNTESAATHVRFSYDAFLDSRAVASATQLAKDSELDRDQLLYFLRNVCVPSVMDMNRHIGSSRAAELERRAICSVLCEIDPEQRGTYEGEIVSMVNADALNEGIRLVDSSRIHVDTNALKAWARREWGANFERYRVLSESGIGKSKDLDALLKEVTRLTHTSVILLQAPDSEADQVLVELMIALREKFLTDPQHGLDSYLSRRVRHHSMGGYLRGPLEEVNLITFKLGSKRYAENSYWADKVQNLTPRERERLIRHFEQFAEEVDRTITYLKKDVFRVRSAEHTRGIFDIPIGSRLLYLARSISRADPTLNTFCDFCFLMFWSSLDPSLQLAQKQLRVDTKNTLSGAFHRLRAALKKTLVDAKRYAELSAAISTASERVLRETDRIADWFVRREVHATPSTYSLSKAFEIAMKSALESHRPFDPKVSLAINGDCQVRTTDLIAVAEIVLTTIGNAKQYSEGVGAPSLNINVDFNPKEQLLNLRIENRVGWKHSRENSAERLDAIRSQIDDGTYIERVRVEGESGLMKIASTISQFARGNFDFGFMDDRLFFTEVTMDLSA
jgi:hypothetical protein